MAHVEVAVTWFGRYIKIASQLSADPGGSGGPSKNSCVRSVSSNKCVHTGVQMVIVVALFYCGLIDQSTAKTQKGSCSRRK